MLGVYLDSLYLFTSNVFCQSCWATGYGLRGILAETGVNLVTWNTLGSSGGRMSLKALVMSIFGY